MTAPSEPLPRLPSRQPDSHKGDFGRALLIGGSRGMSGAIALAGMACLRGGAGLVTLAVPESIGDIVAGFEPSYMTAPLPDDRRGRFSAAAIGRLLRLPHSATVVALGPGMGQSVDVRRIVQYLYERVACPMVVDADGLNALARRPELLASHAGPRILTPHPGELRRLIGAEGDLTRDELETAATELARRNNVVVVLKGRRSLITDGRAMAHNTTGNPGMATGGTGDVLTGVITALVAQGLDAWSAARFGVYVHGLAGDLAAASLGQPGMIASDVIKFLPEALRQIDHAS